MSNVILTWHQAGNRAKNRGENMPVPRAPEGRTEIVLASATAVRSLLRANANTVNTKEDGAFVTVRTAEKAVQIVTGSAPVAVKAVVGTVSGGNMTGGTQASGHYQGAYETQTYGVNYNDYVSMIEY